MLSMGWKVEYPLVGPRVGEPGAPGPTPVTLKLLPADHAPCVSVPFTAWTRQKYVPLARPLTVSCVGPIVEFCRTTGVKLDEGLTCQL